jgi:hypothetical protein
MSETAIREDVAMQTRDAVALLADVYAPDDGEGHPTLLVRTPYGKSDRKLGHRPPEVDFFTAHGYTVVVQDTRGRGLSEGAYYPWIYEELDGYDAIEWAAGLPESNGAVGTTGQSYCASAQYLTAPSRPAHLKAMCPVSGPVSFFKQRIYRQGVLELGWSVAYALGMSRLTLVRSGRYREERSTLDGWVTDPTKGAAALTDEAYRQLPVGVWGERLAMLGAPYLRDLLGHDTDGPYWWATDVSRRIRSINVPMFHVGSWYDAFQYDTLALFTSLSNEAEEESTRRSQRLLMGPWGHLQPYTRPTSNGTGDIDFGPEAKIELFEQQLRWFDFHLAGVDNGLAEEAPVRIFVMGINRWRDEDAWPLLRAREQQMYLHGDGPANSLRGVGSLSRQPPGDEAHDLFLYDPEHPVPTCGGPTPGEGLGVRDQRQVEERDDVLVYSSSPLAEPLEITGYLKVTLYASTSGPDTDFVAKFVDVWPDGFAQNVAEGIVRARYRESITEPRPIEPHVVYRYNIELGATSHVVLPGHSVRLDITSSNFPRHDRNPNTGGSPLTETTFRIARQRIFHDHRYPSHLALPVVEA